MIFHHATSTPAVFSELLAQVADPAARAENAVRQGDARLLAVIADQTPSL